MGNRQRRRSKRKPEEEEASHQPNKKARERSSSPEFPQHLIQALYSALETTPSSSPDIHVLKTGQGQEVKVHKVCLKTMSKCQEFPEELPSYITEQDAKIFVKALYFGCIAASKVCPRNVLF